MAMSRSYFEEFCSRDIDGLMEIFHICLEESWETITTDSADFPVRSPIIG